MSLHINVGKPRTFGDLTPLEDHVFIIDPGSGVVVKSQVRAKRILKSNGQVAILEIEIYKLTSNKNITNDKLELANKEHNTDISWRFRVVSTSHMGPVKFKGQDAPTVISSDEKHLKKWMSTTGLQRRKIIY